MTQTGDMSRARSEAPRRWAGGELLLVAWLCLMLALATGCASRAASASAGAPSIALTIQNKGSDTLVNLALAWAELYMSAYPEISISVTGGGTGTGIAALLNGTVDIANASRQIKA